MALIIKNINFLVVGMVLLIKGADFFVDGASNIARRLRIPSLIIGLTLVSIGTSAPELSISVTSAMKGMNEMSFGNVVGSNIFNTLIVVGVSALFTKLTIASDVKRFDIPILIGIYALLTVFGFTGKEFGFSRIEAGVLLALFAAYVAFLIIRNKNDPEDDSEKPTQKWYLSILFSVVGIAAIIYGGDLVVDSASILAKKCGMSELLVGLTIVAIGTSLPELVTSIVAAKKGEMDMAIGNAVGSSIMNSILILGTTAVITPIKIDLMLIIDVAVMIFSVLILFFATLKKNEIGKGIGISMIVVYLAYIAYTVTYALLTQAPTI